LPSYRLVKWMRKKFGRTICPKCGKYGIYRVREVIGFCGSSYELYLDHGRRKPRFCFIKMINDPSDLPAPTHLCKGVQNE